ncbi:MAG: LPS-assembly protein LptD [Burkholderiales bacterium]
MIVCPRKSRIALALLCALPALAVAQQGLQLRPQPSLIDLPATNKDDTPMYMEGDRLQGHTDRETEAQGSARFRGRGQSISADWMRHDKRDNELTAIGNVRLEQGSEITEGARLRYNLDTSRGLMESARYSLSPKETGIAPGTRSAVSPFDARGSADRVVFEGPGLLRAQQATYTTCEPGDDSWLFRAREMLIDKNNNIGTARDANIEFLGTTIFYTPYMWFTLHQERKSGFLTPHYGNSSTGGFELSVPYYWNMAPNRDMTLTPRVLSRRGLQLRTDFRYLEPNYKGQLDFEYLPNDNVTGANRQLLKFNHAHSFANGWAGALDLNHVSDGKYFSDLSTQVALTSQTYLVRQGSLSRGGAWGNGGTYSFSALAQNWQTLQTDPLAPLVPPYGRRPQLSFSAQKQDVLRGDFDVISSFADFSHPTLVNGKRFMAYPSLAVPLTASYGYVTPKVGLHLTRYALDKSTTTLPNKSRVLPTFTVDSGLLFERGTNLFGKSFTQTLEPKLYYVNIPYRDQTLMPNFDSGLQDINFATIYSENQFSGHDRINDANQLTFGVNSRLIHPDTGIEVLRAGLAQRYYFRPQQVFVPGVPVRSNQSSRSDLLAALSGNVAPHWTAEFGWQYNTDTSETQRMNVGARYQPQQGKVLNLSYRHTINSIRQFDISGQWPVSGKWNAVGRWNYSTQDKRLLEAVAGVEYDGGCWALRVVGHRLSTAIGASTSAVFVELELNGVTRVGSNPLEVLRRNVSGYTRYDPRQSRPNEYFVPNQ